LVNVEALLKLQAKQIIEEELGGLSFSLQENAFTSWGKLALHIRTNFFKWPHRFRHWRKDAANIPSQVENLD